MIVGRGFIRNDFEGTYIARDILPIDTIELNQLKDTINIPGRKEESDFLSINCYDFVLVSKLHS